MYLPASLILTFCACGAALQAQQRIDGSKEPDQCYEGEKLYFIHVMKDGGSSIDYWFSCLADEMHLAVTHSEGFVSRVKGDASCDPAICAAHAAAVDKTKVCGSSFKSARSMTALREPISRVFSLYTYYKYHDNVAWLNNPAPKRDGGGERDFEWLMQRIIDGKNGESIHGFDNEMVKIYFSPNPLTLLMAHGAEKSQQLLESNYLATGADLTAAKKVLRTVDAIFFTEHFNTFLKDYVKSGLPFAENVTDTNCPFKHINELDCGGCPSKPTAKEYEMAKQLNSLDIELYNYALSLPSAIK